MTILLLKFALLSGRFKLYSILNNCINSNIASNANHLRFDLNFMKANYLYILFYNFLNH